ncbi:peptidoglycan-binding domain-containing protein [Streptomyces sp. NPDC102283]|uniref:peptidoglycan-binding domain-containing protein n=1 Tax=Streptomyces sp. NPDC102283 TaxID=3366155 RepID=UPI00382D912B
MTGHACPECGRRTAGEPGTEHRAPCRCGVGASAARLTEDEQRAARAAEIAAAEDFDPLRIRPYVTLTDHAGPAGDGDGDGGSRSGSGTWEGAAASGTWEGAAAGTVPPDPDTAGAAGAAGTGEPAIDPGAASAATMPLFLAGAAQDAGTDMGMGAGTGMGAGGPGSPGGATRPAPDGSRRRTAGSGPAFGSDPVRPRRRRPFGALAVGAAVAAVVGTAAFAGGLFGGDDGTDEALPEATTSAPDTEEEPAASVAPSPSASAAPPRTRSPSATPSASTPPSASPAKSRESSPTASASASPKASASPTADDDAPPAPPADPPPGLAASSLRPGDHGPEVTELQNRLKEVWLYAGPFDGNYNDQVRSAVVIYQSYQDIEGDPVGVYGPNTRGVLEAETNGHGRH